MLSSNQQRLKLSPFFFFVFSFFLFSLGLGKDIQAFHCLAPSLFWILILFTTILSTESLFQEEWERGLLDLWVLSPLSFSKIIALQVKNHCLYFGLPFIGIGFVFCFLYGFSIQESMWFLMSLILGIPSLSLIGIMISCFKLGGRGSILLSALILFPLYLPILILGISVPEGDPWPGLKGLLGLLILNTVLGPLFGGWALKQSVMR